MVMASMMYWFSDMGMSLIRASSCFVHWDRYHKKPAMLWQAVSETTDHISGDPKNPGKPTATSRETN
jgi:hypothetical protein